MPSNPLSPPIHRPLTEAHPLARPYLPGGDLCPLLCASLGGVGGYVTRRTDHFFVHECPQYPPSGSGDHSLSLILKEGKTTEEVIQLLARSLKLKPRDIGYAGRKDKEAITTQWFSLPCSPQEVWLDDPQVCLLYTTAHDKKLRLGHLSDNLFSIYLSELRSPERLQTHLDILSGGVPNYFGRQRFGRVWYPRRPEADYTLLCDERDRPIQDPDFPAQDNVDRAIFTLNNPKRRRKSRDTKLLISALQSALFNLWLGERLKDDLLDRVIEGDVCRKIAGGTFNSTEPEVDTERLKRGEIEVLGPLLGPKLFPSRALAHHREEDLYERWGITQELRVAMGRSWRGDRRRTMIRARGLKVTHEGGGVWLHFILPSGGFATTLLTELIQPQELFERVALCVGQTRDGRTEDRSSRSS